SPVVPADSYLSTKNVLAKIPDPADSTKFIDAPVGTVNPSVIRNYTFESPGTVTTGGTCGEAPDPAIGGNVLKARRVFIPIGGDTQFIYNLEYRIPIFSMLSVAAFGDVGTAFNSRKYQDQLSVTNFVNQQIAPSGVTLNPAGRVATAEELASAPRDVLGN